MEKLITGYQLARTRYARTAFAYQDSAQNQTLCSLHKQRVIPTKQRQ